MIHRSTEGEIVLETTALSGVEDHNPGVHGSIAGIAASSLSRIQSKMGDVALAVRATLVPAYFLNLVPLRFQHVCG